MNMDHTGETADRDEGDARAEVAEVVEVDEVIEIIAELEEDGEVDDGPEVDDAPVVLDASDDAVVEDEPIDVEDHEVDAVEEERAESRHRHPAGAAAIAKRVAMDRSARIAVGSLVLVAMMFLFVFPTRSYLAQHRQVRDARHSVQVLRAQNAKLAREAKRLQTPDEIEKLARSQFNMVFEGEEAYNVVPPQGTPTTTTTAP